MICGIHGFGKDKTGIKIRQLAGQFDLDTVLHRKAGKLSGGWQRRVSIAMALISQPQILFLDEPTLGLDVIARHELWETIRALKGRVTIILTTHYMEEAEALSDRIAIMKNGRLIDEVTEKEIVTKCQCCLKLKVSDAVKGAMLIENRLHSTSYEVAEDNVLRVFEYVDNPNVINSLFVQEGIQVYECSVSQESLEDYFNEKIQGGNRND